MTHEYLTYTRVYTSTSSERACFQNKIQSAIADTKVNLLCRVIDNPWLPSDSLQNASFLDARGILCDPGANFASIDWMSKDLTGTICFKPCHSSLLTNLNKECSTHPKNIFSFKQLAVVNKTKLEPSLTQFTSFSMPNMLWILWWCIGIGIAKFLSCQLAMIHSMGWIMLNTNISWQTTKNTTNIINKCIVENKWQIWIVFGKISYVLCWYLPLSIIYRFCFQKI